MLIDERFIDITSLDSEIQKVVFSQVLVVSDEAELQAS